MLNLPLTMASSSSSSSSSDASRGSLPRGLFRPDLYQGQGRNADYVLLSEEVRATNQSNKRAFEKFG